MFLYSELEYFTIFVVCCIALGYSELEGQFDIIWDSAAFVAVNQKEKQQWVINVHYQDSHKSLWEYGAH